MWSADGDALYYRGALGGRDGRFSVSRLRSSGSDQQIFNTTIRTKPVFSRSEPESFFKLSIPFIASDFDQIANRFLMTQPGPVDSSQINVVLNWLEELMEKVPVL